jgi:hypothetical protein
MACRTATYSGDPSSSAKDEVRFWLSDLNLDRPLFFDAEIEFTTSLIPNARMAAAQLLELKAGEFARKGDIRVGDVSKAFTKAADSMKKCAQLLREQAVKSAKPFFGGLTISGKQALLERTDDVQPQFFIGQTDNPFAVQMNHDVNDLFGLAGSSVI